MSKLIKYRIPSLAGKGRTFSYMMFIYAFSAALLAPVFPSYIGEISGSDGYVGFLLAICSFSILIGSFIVAKLLCRFSRIMLLYVAFFGLAAVSLLFYFIETVSALVVIQVLKGLLLSILFVVIPLMVKDFTPKKFIGREEGIYYWFINLALVLGPVTGGVMALFWGVEALFLVAAVVLVFGAMFLSQRNVVKIGENNACNKSDVFKNLVRFFSNKRFVRAYIIDLGLYLWWAAGSVAVPLYLISHGFSPLMVGVVIALKFIPLIVFEKWIGDRAKPGFLGISMMKGFIIVSVAMFLLALVNQVSFSIAMVLVASIGVAFIEPVKETYLFLHMKKRDENDLFPIYATARQLGYLAGELATGFLIMFFGYQALFFSLSFALLPMVLVGYLISKE